MLMHRRSSSLLEAQLSDYRISDSDRRGAESPTLTSLTGLLPELQSTSVDALAEGIDQDLEEILTVPESICRKAF